MTLEDVKKFIEGYHNGHFMSIQFSKELKPLKEYGSHTITKTTTSIVRMGINYEHMKSVALKRSTGELPKFNSGLPWGRWETPGYIIEHKGEYYVRVYNINGVRTHTKYYYDGKRVSREFLENICVKSSFGSGDKPDCFTINIKNIERMG